MKKAIYLPFLAFIFAFLIHAAWAIAKASEPCLAQPGDKDPFQEGLSVLLNQNSERYFAAQDYFLSFSYALLAAFTTYALLKLVENRKTAIAAASGGLLLTGGIYALTCFAIGCCGSPLLAVYLGALGSHLAGFEKPILAGITTVSVTAGWWWCRRCRPNRPPCCPPNQPCN